MNLGSERHRRSPARFFPLLFGLAALLPACTSAGVRPDNAAALADIASHSGGREVVVEGIVTRVDASEGGPSGVHEHFSVRITAGAASREVAIADNITIGEPAPVRAGDDVIVKGVLEDDPSGPTIHWTHHDPANRHPSGFVIVHGTMYD